MSNRHYFNTPQKMLFAARWTTLFSVDHPPENDFEEVINQGTFIGKLFRFIICSFLASTIY
jgi:hypothetical protein